MGCTNEKTQLNYMTPDSKAQEILGETICHVNSSFPNTDEYIAQIEKTTVLDLAIKSFANHANLPCLGFRKPLNATDYANSYTFYSYREVYSMALNFAQNMKANKLVEEVTFEDTEGKWRIYGIFARNCTEWVVNDFACQMDDITSVTFYSTLGAESFDHIFGQTQVQTVAVSPENIKKLIEFYKKFKFETLKNVVVYNMTVLLEDKDLSALKELGLNIYLFTDLIKEPETKLDLKPAEPNSILTFCYTSGTTSLPKGALLTQKGFATQKYLLADTGIILNTNDIMISYLPLAHVMERVSIFSSIISGSRIGFISGLDVKKYLMEDLLILKPTVLVAVPRILINFHQKVLDTFSKLTGCKKSMADKGLKIKRQNYVSNRDIAHSFYDKIVFKKIREKFGGNLRALISGSAPIPRDICIDIKLMLSIPLVEGYGMTELSGGSNGTSIYDFSNSNVGGVLRTLRLKLVDKKELNYHSETKVDGRLAPTGEICYKGPSLFKGYFRDPKNTAETLDSDGWLHTGDVGMIDPINKGLKIVDRVKEIFKLSQGEYIAPAKLEGAYNKSPFVAQICIYGNSEKSNIVAIVVVNKQKCAETLAEAGILKDSTVTLEETHLKEPKLIEAIKANFDEIAKANKFNSLEKPPKFILTFQEFTIQNDLLTPTMKLVRKKIQNFFQSDIDQAYA